MRFAAGSFCFARRMQEKSREKDAMRTVPERKPARATTGRKRARRLTRAREPASIAALCVSGLELFRDRYGCLFDATPSLPITARRERERGKSERGSANSPGRSVFSGIAPPVMQCAFSYFWEKGFGAFFFFLLLTLPLRDLPCRLRRSGSSVYGVLSGGCKERQGTGSNAELAETPGAQRSCFVPCGGMSVAKRMVADSVARVTRARLAP